MLIIFFHVLNYECFAFSKRLYEITNCISKINEAIPMNKGLFVIKVVIRKMVKNVTKIANDILNCLDIIYSFKFLLFFTTNNSLLN